MTVTAMAAAAWGGPLNMGDPESPHGLAGMVMTGCYAPLLLWGPFLLAVTVEFVQRHRAA